MIFLKIGIVGFMFIILIIVLYCINNRMKSFINFLKIKNYDSYIATLEFHCRKSFDVIYKQQIMIYSIEATSLDSKMLDKAIKDYLNLTLKFLGPELINQYIEFYGSVSTLYLNINNYFKNEYESDEIKKTSISNLMNNEENINPPQ